MDETELGAGAPSRRNGLFSRPVSLRHTRAGSRSSRAALVLTVALVAGCAGAFPAAPASASTPNFCPFGSGAGQCDDPQSVAVDQSNGTVYVGESNNARIDEFDAGGSFLRAFGYGVLNGAHELQMCETTCVKGLLEGLGGSAPPGFVRPTSIAVDPASHDVYAADSGDERVERYSPAGKLELMFGEEVDKTTHANVCTAEDIEVKHDVCAAGVKGTGGGAFSTTRLPLAIDSAGNVLVGDNERVERFSQDGVFLSEMPLPSAGEVLSLAVDVDPASASYEDFYTTSPSFEEMQSVTPPVSGNYALTFEGQTTAPLSFSATAGEVDEALQSLSTIGPGNVTVFSSSSPYTVRFESGLGGTNVPQLEISAGSVATLKDGVPSRLRKFSSSGTPLEMLDASGQPNAVTVDPATGNMFVSDQIDPTLGRDYGKATLLEYDPSGTQIEAFGSGEVIGDPVGNALVFGDGAQRLYIVSNASEAAVAAQIFTLPAPGPLPGAGTAKAVEVHKTFVTLCSQVNPEGKSTTAHFQYVSEAKFEEDGESFGPGTLTTFESASLGSDFQSHEVCQAVPSLAPGTTYRFRLVATNSNAPAGIDGETASSQTLPSAAIDSVSASDVTAESATLATEVNPLGDSTSYRFEYLSEAAYQKNALEALPPFTGAARVPAVDGSLGAGSVDVAVSQHLQGLQAGTVYRYRVVVSNAVSEASGGAVASRAFGFTTQSLGALGLPDGRAWELVSPPDKHGAQLLPIGKGTIQASVSGDAVAYLASAATEAEPQSDSNYIQVLSTRGTGASSWTSHDIPPLHTNATGFSLFGTEYRMFSSDLSLGLLQPFGAFEPSLSAAASEQTPFLRSDFASGDPTAYCTSSCYRPLVTGCPTVGEPCSASVEEAADVPAGTAFGEDRACTGEHSSAHRQKIVCGPLFVGGTPDLAHVVLSSSIGLTSMPGDKGGLYEWSGGSLELISVLPSGVPATGNLALGHQALGLVDRNAISPDGSRVFFSAGGHLYLRYNATVSQSAMLAGRCGEPQRACTVQLDAVQGGPGGGEPPNSEFQMASTAGSRVFFTDTQQLTADAGSSPKGSDLYECRIVEETGGLGCDLHDLTPENAGEPAAVQGLLGASPDGASAYFTADGVLAHDTVENGNGEEQAKPGSCVRGNRSPGETCNLYLDHEGTIAFIGIVSGMDQPDWGESNPALENLTARVSVDGRWLAFMSQRPLTGYDNRDASSGQPDEEVYLYHTVAGGSGGRLVCVSCDATGARPHGLEFHKNGSTEESGMPLAGGQDSWQPTQWLAAIIPGWTSSRYQSPYLSNGGRLFFDSSDALVPSDTNGVVDVYEFEPPGGEGAPSGDGCTSGSAAYSPVSGGCVELISSGSSTEESAFLDASESGADVFFLTSAKLVSQDFDTSLDVYDARVSGGSVEPGGPPACEGDACQSPVSAPQDLTPASLTFSGAGNVSISTGAVAPRSKQLTRAQKLANALHTCKKKPKRKRAACERQARKAYGAKSRRADRKGGR